MMDSPSLDYFPKEAASSMAGRHHDLYYCLPDDVRAMSLDEVDMPGFLDLDWGGLEFLEILKEEAIFRTYRCR